MFVDILVATYNGEKYISQQIQSLLDQSYSNIKIIISDDGSTDKTIDIIKKFEENNPNITVYLNKFGNSNENFSFLIEKSTSQFVALCDQDDFWEQTKIEKLVSYMNLNEEVSLVYCDYYITNSELKIQSKGSEASLKRNFGKFDISFFQHNTAPGCCMLVKTEVAKKAIPILRNDTWHDWKIFIISSLNGETAFYNEPLIFYRQHDNNQIGTNHNKKKLSSKINNYNLLIECLSNYKPGYSKKLLKGLNKKIYFSPTLFLSIIKCKSNLSDKVFLILLFNYNYIYKKLYNLKK